MLTKQQIFESQPASEPSPPLGHDVQPPALSGSIYSPDAHSAKAPAQTHTTKTKAANIDLKNFIL